MGPRNQNGISKEIWRHCSSGPIKISIFDIYRSMLTQSNCLGLSSSILFFMGIFTIEIKILFLYFGFIGYSIKQNIWFNFCNQTN